MLTLLPGEVSTSSMLGMASPTWTLARAEDWKPRAARGSAETKRRVANILIVVVDDSGDVVLGDCQESMECRRLAAAWQPWLDVNSIGAISALARIGAA